MTHISGLTYQQSLSHYSQPSQTIPALPCRTSGDSDTMVHCCQVNNGTQARQDRPPPADPSWTGAPALCCTSPRGHPLSPHPPFRGGALHLNAAGLLADPTIPPGGEPAQAKQVPPPAPKPPLPASRVASLQGGS
jgi:hypothetical protein